MESKKSGRYESKCEEGDLESLNERLTQDLRNHIHQINNHPVLSEQWVNIAGLMGRIHEISDAEARLPKDKKNGTLWETEELALRYILEDGKLNVCLRMLVDFSTFQRENERRRSVTDEQQTKLDLFEKGLGQVLRNTWKHVEALQTTDLPLLLQHVTEVLRAGAVTPNEKLEKSVKSGDVHERQEVLVMHYLNDLLEHAQRELDESRFMPQVKDLRLFQTLAKFMRTHVQNGVLREDDLLVGFSALSLLSETEDFQTYEDDFLDEDCERDMEALEPKAKDFKYDDRTRSKVAPIYRVIQDHCLNSYK